MPQKRLSEDEGNGHMNGNGVPVKHAKTERPEDFSKQVAKKLKDSNRTGQACDRCKVSSALPHLSRVSINPLPDPQDQMRRTLRGMYTMRTESIGVCYYR